ncbi:patched domain-containing protein 3 [Aplysia californica]|uniref:Patched domain-containing protein 3 n=1 Tax=Aplysia californica TaxID=6500 RepID=A0ABM1A1C4_APLCA|nr:patched domain-containing protein 3 [Aplysia californica]
MRCVWNCQRAVLSGFYKYGHFLGSHPAPFLVLPLLICSGLAVGFLFYNPETDVEKLYAPMDSRAVKDRSRVEAAFPDLSGTNFDPFSTNRLIAQAVTIFRSRNEHAIFTEEVIEELSNFYDSVWEIRIQDDGKNYTYNDLCAVKDGVCAVDGAFLFSAFFKGMLSMNAVTFPVWSGIEAMDLQLYFSDVNVSRDGILQAAGSYKMAFPLRTDTEKLERLSLAWELAYIDFMSTVNLTTVDISYAVSQSLNLELDKGTSGDIFYFSLTFTIMITYASIVSSGGDCVSTRALLANAGVVAALLGTLGAFGLITLIGVRFVNIVGVMPFLTLGIGVDDMFLLMNSWSETTALTDLSVPERIGTVFRKAGVGITITSVTDFLAFVVGSSSVFKSVRNFCIYTGVGVLLCYICNATFFGACLTYHGRRVYSSRHTITCRKLDQSRPELKEEGHKCCYICMCGGATPKGPGDDQSPCEKGPRSALTRLVLWNPMRVLILLIFAGYLGMTVWGLTMLKQGLELKNLVLTSSYFHKFQVWDTEDFGVKLPISFVMTNPMDYRSDEGVGAVRNVLDTAQQDVSIDPLVEKCWLMAYGLSSSYNTSTEELFFSGLEEFLKENPRYTSDVILDAQNRTVTASRCFVYSYKVTDSNDQADLMTRMREVADNDPLDTFAYHPAFVYFEQYVSVLPSTLQTVGITIAVMFVVTCIFLPHPMIVALVMIQVVMIVTGVFGFMGLWGLSLSSITMIQLIMSVGFSVDFCAHVCTAYMVSEEYSRRERAKEAIVHASGPILNGGMSSLIGVIVLVFTESYIFQSFCKIMLLVIGFGTAHAVLLIPVILSFVGPQAHTDSDDASKGPHMNGKRYEVSAAAQNGSPEVKNGTKNGGQKNGKTNDSVARRGLPHKAGSDMMFVNPTFQNDAHLGYLQD